MPKSIDPKSFIIGVLSAIVVCMAMGADSDEPKKKWSTLSRSGGYTNYETETYKNWDHEQFWDTKGLEPYEGRKGSNTKGWEPFAATTDNGKHLVWFRKPQTFVKKQTTVPENPPKWDKF